MLSSLITIIIPCENSLPGIKSTIENLLDQTKIRGTRVIVLDKGSKDGSIQYSIQAGYDLSKRLTIETFNVTDNKDFYKVVNTPYVLWISPGLIFKSRDYIFDAINLLSKKGDFCIRPHWHKNFFKRIFTKYYLKSGKMSAAFIFGKSYISENIEYKKDSGFFNIKIEKSAFKKKFYISRNSTKFLI